MAQSHVVPVRRSTCAIFAALLVLTSLTVPVAFVDLGPFSTA